MKINQLILGALLFLCHFAVMAHSGHDHTDPKATLIHLLWIAPGVIAAGLLYRRFFNKTAKHQIAKHQTDKHQ